jgi:hypothetical protein
MAKDDPGATTPAAAVARHLEWLEYALEAARDEERRRQGRLERATDKNREKRIVRLGEVTAEIRELEALVKGLRDLRTKAAAASASRARSASTRTNGSGSGADRPVARPQASAASEVEPASAPKANPRARTTKAKPAPSS